MTDETETEATELFFEDGGEPLTFNSYTGATEEQRYLRIKKEIEAKQAAGEPVYVQIMDNRRIGSIGRLETIEFDYRPANSNNSSYWGRSNQPYLGVRNIKVVWDKRKNSCEPYCSEVEYLPDFQGPTTVWNWTKGEAKDKPEPVIAYDHLGQELEIGQFVCFVHRLYGNTSMKFGTVTRFTAKGSVFIKTLKLRDGTRGGDELKALSMDDVVICNDKLMARLVMARLSAD